MSKNALPAHFLHIQETVKQLTGIPMLIGAAPTKTLAEFANRMTKKSSGVFTLLDSSIQNEVLSQMDVADLWGIGRQWTKLLKHHGIETVLQLRFFERAGNASLVAP